MRNNHPNTPRIHLDANPSGGGDVTQATRSGSKQSDLRAVPFQSLRFEPADHLARCKERHHLPCLQTDLDGSLARSRKVPVRLMPEDHDLKAGTASEFRYLQNRGVVVIVPTASDAEQDQLAGSLPPGFEQRRYTLQRQRKITLIFVRRMLIYLWNPGTRDHMISEREAVQIPDQDLRFKPQGAAVEVSPVNRDDSQSSSQVLQMFEDAGLASQLASRHDHQDFFF